MVWVFSLAPLQTLGSLDILAAVLGIYLAFRLTSKPKHLLPPGPYGLPFVGNALQWPKVDAWKTFSLWRQVYGPIVYLNIYGRHVIILNTPEAIFELLERRGANYSDRPRQRLLELSGWSNSAGSLQYGPRLTQMRRMILTVGGKAGVERYSFILNQERHRFLRRLLQDPGTTYVKHLQTSAAASIIDINYGHDITDENDHLIKVLDKGINSLAPVLDDRVLADYFPILRHLPTFLPGMHLHRLAQQARNSLEEAIEKPYAYVKEQIALGMARASFTSEQINEANITPEKEDLIRWASVTIYGVGFETTVSAINHFIVAMILFPEVQIRAQAELDDIIGSGRLPVLEDRDNLPYIMAILKETLRWIPLAPDGVPHRARHDDIYMGYYIPSNATVIPNLCGILHNPEIYRNPEKFSPERFLGEAPEPDPSDFAFGFGRRICAGKHFAEASIFLHASALLSIFNIKKPQASPLIDHNDWSNIPRYPTPLPCTFEPRSEEARTLAAAIAFRGEVEEPHSLLA